MKRNVNLEDISDGKLYGLNDRVEADCKGCGGCHLCCTGMGDSVRLDPYDVDRMTVALDKSMSDLVKEGKIGFSPAGRLLLPHLMMDRGEEEACGFLSGEGRCTIHPVRPGFCRLFPLGRLYDEMGVRYFLQVKECPHPNRGSAKVKFCLGEKDPWSYQRFVLAWHDLLAELEHCLEKGLLLLKPAQQASWLESMLAHFVEVFYGKKYQPSFFSDFYARMEQYERQLTAYMAEMKQKNSSHL